MTVEYVKEERFAADLINSTRLFDVPFYGGSITNVVHILMENQLDQKTATKMSAGLTDEEIEARFHDNMRRLFKRKVDERNLGNYRMLFRLMYDREPENDELKLLTNAMSRAKLVPLKFAQLFLALNLDGDEFKAMLLEAIELDE